MKKDVFKHMIKVGDTIEWTDPTDFEDYRATIESETDNSITIKTVEEYPRVITLAPNDYDGSYPCHYLNLN